MFKLISRFGNVSDSESPGPAKGAMGAAPSSPAMTLRSGDVAEVAELKRSLAAAVAAAAVAVAAAADAEARATAAELKRLLADAATARALKVAFVRWLDSIAASGSESSPADSARLGAPLPVTASEDDVLLRCPRLAASQVRSAWAAYTAAHAPSVSAGGKYHTEVRAVQPSVARLTCAAAGDACALRAWHGKVAADDVAATAMAPDQMWTHARDAAPSTIGALLIIEVKKPGNVDIAVVQAVKYLRRRVAALFHEANARGETGHDIFALGAATGGCSVVLLRMTSGACADGTFPEDLRPCLVLATAPLPLLEGWDFTDAAWVPPALPPAGFTALVRALRAPPGALGSGLPLAALDVTLEPAGERDTLVFDSRLGCGGTSDVYALRPRVGGRLAGAAAKAPRFATADVVAQFRREADALTALALDSADVPTVVYEGVRAGTSPGHVDACHWPVLVLAPAGEPLCSYVGRLVVRERFAAQSGGEEGAAEACALRVTTARLALADRVTAGVLGVLRLAHARGLIHCDVRPANIIVVHGDDLGGGERVLLIDWGACVDARTNVVCRGVPAFSPSELYLQSSYAARPALDLAALAHTWLAVAYGSEDASAPWVAAALEPPEKTLHRRAMWLKEHTHEAAVVAPLLCRGCDAGDAGVYVWARGGGAIGLQSRGYYREGAEECGCPVAPSTVQATFVLLSSICVVWDSGLWCPESLPYASPLPTAYSAIGLSDGIYEGAATRGGEAFRWRRLERQSKRIYGGLPLPQ